MILNAFNFMTWKYLGFYLKIETKFLFLEVAQKEFFFVIEMVMFQSLSFTPHLHQDKKWKSLRESLL